MRNSNDEDDSPDWEKAIRPYFTAAEDKEVEGARPSSFITVHRPAVIDPLQELNLLRMMRVANERTVRELGPLPPRGLLVQEKRKPNAPYMDFLGREVPQIPIAEENDEMKLNQIVAMAALTVGGLVACSEGQSQQAVNIDSAALTTKTATHIDKARTSEAKDEATLSPTAQTPMKGEKKLTFRELSAIAGVDCKDPDNGLACSTGNYEVGDYYDVVMSPGCGEKGLFAIVKNKRGAGLLDWAPPKDTVVRATLAEGQLVCIQATAHIKGLPSYYYVTVVPVASIKSCVGNHACAMYGDREVKWHVKHEGGVCQSDGPWVFSGDCATGWADAEDFDVSPNGL